MTPVEALVLCSALIFVLLRIERKQEPRVSPALWIPVLWMLSITGKPLGAWFSESGDFESGSPFDQYYLSALLCLGLLVLASRNYPIFKTIKANPWVWALLGYMLVSILWSDIPFIAFKRWVREVIVVVMAFLVLSERDPRQAMQSLVRRTIYIFIPLSLLLIKFFPEYGRVYGRWSGAEMWVGVTTQKNALGRLCLIAVFFLAWALITRKNKKAFSVSRYQIYADVSILVMALFLTAGPGGQYSATAIVSLTVGAVAMFSLYWMKKCGLSVGANAFRALMICIIAIGVAQPFLGGSSVGGAASAIGRDTTLTGRTEIWDGLVPIIRNNPMWGSGFESFWIPQIVEAHDIGEAHNGYLDVLLNLGGVGLLFVVMYILSSCQKLERMLACDYDWGVLWLCFVFMVLIHNITESSIHTLANPLTALLLLFLVSSTSVVSFIVRNAIVSSEKS